jgi:drug/metabolite transporter (DMT)-like permease
MKKKSAGPAQGMVFAALLAGASRRPQELIAYALVHLRAAFSSMSLLFQPVMAAVFAWWLLAEPLVALQVAGEVLDVPHPACHGEFMQTNRI